MPSQEYVFISYAWGGPLSKKEWLRHNVVDGLDSLNVPVFWDRDDVLPGQSVDTVIAKALRARPIIILCICDDDYVAAAARAKSGLARELDMFAQMTNCDDVRITPIVLEKSCKNTLPPPIADRVYVDLSELHKKGIRLGSVLYAIVNRATQAEIAKCVSAELEFHALQEKAHQYIAKHPLKIHGYGNTHEVWVNHQRLLLPPAWMLNAFEWANRMVEDVEGFCPSRGIWTWSYSTPSTGMCALGTAICSALFEEKRDDDDLRAIAQCGALVAERIISMIKEFETFVTDEVELIHNLMQTAQGRWALAHLLR